MHDTHTLFLYFDPPTQWQNITLSPTLPVGVQQDNELIQGLLVSHHVCDVHCYFLSKIPLSTTCRWLCFLRHINKFTFIELQLQTHSYHLTLQLKKLYFNCTFSALRKT